MLTKTFSSLVLLKEREREFRGDGVTGNNLVEVV